MAFLGVCTLLFSLSLTAPAMGAPTSPTPSELHFVASPSLIQEGLTQEVSLNCTYQLQPGSSVNTAISLILSKASPNGSVFTEVAAVTTGDRYNVVVKDDLGGQVSGQLVTSGVSYISYTWRYPSDDTQGNYQCKAFGIDNFGHPITTTADQFIEMETVPHDQLIAKIRELQNTLEGQLTLNGNLQSQVDSQKQQLLKCASRDSMEFSTTNDGHTYLISHRNRTNTTAAAEVCGRLGGYLAEVDNSSELTTIFDFLQANSVDEYVVVGGSQEGHPGMFAFQRSGAPVTYLAWRNNEPDNQGCICLDSNVKLMATVDCVSNYIHRFLCEVPN